MEAVCTDRLTPTAVSQLQGGRRGHRVGLFTGWVPGSRKYFRQCSWNQHLLGTGREQKWAKEEVGLAAMQFQGRPQWTPLGALKQGWLFRVVLSWGKGAGSL